MEEEKFFKPKSKEEKLIEALEELKEANFKFACFVGCFEGYVSKILKEESPTAHK